MAPEGSRSTDGTSAQFTNQSRPDAIVRARGPARGRAFGEFQRGEIADRSIQLTRTPRLDTDSCGWAEFAAAGVVDRAEASAKLVLRSCAVP